MKTILFKFSLFTIMLVMLVSFSGGTPAAVEAAPKPSNTPRQTNTPRPSNTPGPTNTPKATNTPRFTATPTLTSSATASAMPSPTATFTNTPTLTFTPTETPTATATPVPDNLLAYWRFDEGSGNMVADSSGNGHTFSMNTPYFGNLGHVWTTPAAPTTFSNPFSLKLLPARPHQTLSSAGTIDLVNKSFSVAMWVARSQTGLNQMFFSQGNCYSSDCFSVDRILLIGFRDSDVFTCGFFQDDLDTSAITLDGNWHHYACTYDAVNHLRKAYKDGVLVGSDTPLGNYVGSGPVEIGLSSGGVFLGSVDEARIYDAALSDARVAALVELDPHYAPSPCTPQVVLAPSSSSYIPQLLQLEADVVNGCGSPPWPDFTPDPFTFTWSCASDTSLQCTDFLASANAGPNRNWIPILNLEEFVTVQIWVTVCLVDHPSVCSTDTRLYEGSPVN